jgi:hypothetical protein
MICAPGLVFSGTKGIGSCFQVLRTGVRFRRCGGHRVSISCGVLLDSFSAILRASGPVFMFCAPGHIFGDTEGVGFRFHILRPWTHFRRCRVRRVAFSNFVCPDSFSAVPRASALIFLFFVPGLIFGGTEGAGSCFHVFCAWTHFRRYRGRRVSISCFALPDSFSAVTRASVSIFMFCALELVLGDNEGVGSCFHILRYQTRVRRYRGRRVPFSCFALPESFSTVPRASGPIFMFCTPGHVFGGPEGVKSRIHVLRYRTRFWRY